MKSKQSGIYQVLINLWTFFHSFPSSFFLHTFLPPIDIHRQNATNHKHHLAHHTDPKTESQRPNIETSEYLNNADT
ncbi:Protein of unknown function [Pyronema omphalodes CBS 100304]|uniref:Uncharacterized protein n=1 Tax=Pyronema omphalodes (strain CBS 100304) TaxID=1076935 RepID=U4KUX0_PYROM|nr:Protein of unknown function [Pyronema omphalodes CBS 100304]